MGLSGGLAANGGASGGSAGVATFNTRTGAVTLSKADVTGTGVLASDIGGRVTQDSVLTADLTGITAQTTFADITGLSLTISASTTEIWLVKQWFLVAAANGVMDMKFAHTVPTGCLMRGGPITGGTTGITGWTNAVTTAAPSAVATQTSVVSLGSAASGTASNGVSFTWIVFGGGTAGVVQPQYAQNTSDAGALQVKAGSCLEAIRLAA